MLFVLFCCLYDDGGLFCQDVVVDEPRIRAINKLADKLIAQKADDSVEKQKASLNDKWRKVQGDLDEHKAKLAASLEIHSFNRDVDDINDRINEKVGVIFYLMSFRFA